MAPSWDGAVQRLRALFVERLDFDPASRVVSEGKEWPRQGPQAAERGRRSTRGCRGCTGCRADAQPVR